ncbi:hypothetical protein R3P38DRAFT_3298881 [Favolaschia claudopus]|uniref:Uncharacterized protein n=1 Tax=Favolaschia claudopus TaxID=2862362 RepID=A0AAV9Z2D0_9AGAR
MLSLNGIKYSTTTFPFSRFAHKSDKHLYPPPLAFRVSSYHIPLTPAIHSSSSDLSSTLVEYYQNFARNEDEDDERKSELHRTRRTLISTTVSFSHRASSSSTPPISLAALLSTFHPPTTDGSGCCPVHAGQSDRPLAPPPASTAPPSSPPPPAPSLEYTNASPAASTPFTHRHVIDQRLYFAEYTELVSPETHSQRKLRKERRDREG